MLQHHTPPASTLVSLSGSFWPPPGLSPGSLPRSLPLQGVEGQSLPTRTGLFSFSLKITIHPNVRAGDDVISATADDIVPQAWLLTDLKGAKSHRPPLPVRRPAHCHVRYRYVHPTSTFRGASRHVEGLVDCLYRFILYPVIPIIHEMQHFASVIECNTHKVTGRHDDIILPPEVRPSVPCRTRYHAISDENLLFITTSRRRTGIWRACSFPVIILILVWPLSLF